MASLARRVCFIKRKNASVAVSETHIWMKHRIQRVGKIARVMRVAPIRGAPVV